MMQYLVRGQMLSFVISILIIGVILMIAFQSIRVGLIGLIPNMMPAIFVGGYMGWMGVPLDMMTATLLPMMLGMAVDDQLHAILGYDLFHADSGMFAVYKNNSEFWVKLKYSF